ncbi:unnamed protein product [Polarella glacialis]|uniref:Major facilitator superfamily (MFS) profile domain-containing protein n=1 Tax=Polarella glacialis TaxID=89957 RepID=A0A813DIU1_POLGL|nr:unnamed protein product [Polarella glacialis]CAE8676975.1 unnamed protein product [Polarella glacialis]
MTDKQIAWSANFYVFCVAYAVGTATAVTSFDFENFVLNEKLMSIGTGCLFVVIVLFSFVSGSVIGILGPKKGMMLALALLTTYFVGYAAAGFVGEESPLQWPFFMISAVGCGTSVSLLGAGLGPWVDRTAVILCQEDEELNLSEVTALLMANFSVILYGLQATFMLILAALQGFLHLSYPVIIVIYGCVSATAVLIMTGVREPPEPEGERQGTRSCKDQGRITLRHYRDPRVLLLAMVPLTVGLVSAWKQTSITGILKETIGENQLGVVSLIEAGTAIFFTKVFEKVIRCVGTNPVILIGTVFFFAMTLLSLFTNLAHDGWWIAVFFVLAGLGNAVYDTAARVIFLDHFPGKRAAVAFAGMNMQQFIGSAVFYFMGAGGMDREVKSKIQTVCTMVLAALIMPCLFLADKLKQKTVDDSSDEELESSDDEHL